MNSNVESVYLETLKAVLIPFRDLAFFTSASEPLTVNFSERPVAKIRIGIQGPGALRLTALGVFRNGEPPHDQLPLEATFKTSELPDESIPLGIPNEPVAAADIAIEVARAENPWIIIDLGAPRELDSLRLYSSEMPRQAWAPLVVEVSQDGESWTLVYSLAERLAAAAKFVASMATQGASSAMDQHAWKVFTDALRLLFRGDRRRVERLLRRSSLPTETISDIRGAVASQILNPMQLDWNHHGIRRTFRYWTTGEKVKYIKTANHFIGRLARELSPNVCLGFGSVLSLVRDQDLIPHDDDLDIIIAFDRNDCPTVTEGFNRLVEFAARHGYRVQDPSPKSHRQFIREGSRKVDIFVGLQENGRISWFPQKRGDLAMSDVFPPLRASMLGVECLIPRNPLRYLESVYGPKWSRPDPSFSHNWQTREYDDIW